MVDIYNHFKDFKSFEILFVDKNQQNQRFICDVKSLENDTVVLSCPKEKAIADVNANLEVNIYTDNGIYSSSSKILSLSENNENIEYVISYPANSKHSQRREYFRADLSVHFKMTIGIDGHGKVKVIDSFSKDLCGKGMSFISEKPFPDHVMIDLELFFKEKTLRSYANLVYSKPIIIDDKQKFVHAFTLTNISHADEDLLVKKCFVHQLHMRKKRNI